MKGARLDAQREQRLRGLLIEFAIGSPSAKHFDEVEMIALRDDLEALLGEITYLRDRETEAAASLATALADGKNAAETNTVLTMVNEALQADLRGLRDEGLRMAFEVNDVRRERERMVELLERARKVSYSRVDAATAELNELNSIYAQLVPEMVRPLGATPQEPRLVAVGA